MEYEARSLMWKRGWMKVENAKRIQKWNHSCRFKSKRNTRWNIWIWWSLGSCCVLLLLFVIVWSCCCSVTKSCATLCHPMDYSVPGFPVLHCLPEFPQTHVCWVSDAIQSSLPLSPLLLLPSIFPITRVFFNESVLHIKWPKYWSFTSILPMNIQDWFPLGLTGLISLLSKGPFVFIMRGR